MSRIDEVKEHWKEITERLSSDPNKFKDYLSFAGKTFKYSFADSALIYVQKPDATMIADLPTWNMVGRRINQGAKSIAVFGEGDKCRYLFDVSLTNGQKIPMQWRMNEKLGNEILTEVNKSYRSLTVRADYRKRHACEGSTHSGDTLGGQFRTELLRSAAV